MILLLGSMFRVSTLNTTAALLLQLRLSTARSSLVGRPAVVHCPTDRQVEPRMHISREVSARPGGLRVRRARCGPAMVQVYVLKKVTASAGGNQRPTGARTDVDVCLVGVSSRCLGRSRGPAVRVYSTTYRPGVQDATGPSAR